MAANLRSSLIWQGYTFYQRVTERPEHSHTMIHTSAYTPNPVAILPNPPPICSHSPWFTWCFTPLLSSIFLSSQTVNQVSVSHFRVSSSPPSSFFFFRRRSLLIHRRRLVPTEPASWFSLGEAPFPFVPSFPWVLGRVVSEDSN